jgi:hypothetical protein
VPLRFQLEILKLRDNEETKPQLTSKFHSLAIDTTGQLQHNNEQKNKEKAQRRTGQNIMMTV